MIEIEDQNSTDLEKCLKHAAEEAGRLLDERYDEKNLEDLSERQRPRLDLVILGGLGGRADQAFSQIHALFAAPRIYSGEWCGKVYLLTETSLMFVLDEGLNTIVTPVGTGLFADHLGIIPMAKPAIISTRGLKWNVDDWFTAVGYSITTSNQIMQPVIQVRTSAPVLLTLELSPEQSKTE